MTLDFESVIAGLYDKPAIRSRSTDRSAGNADYAWSTDRSAGNAWSTDRPARPAPPAGWPARPANWSARAAEADDSRAASQQSSKT